MQAPNITWYLYQDKISEYIDKECYAGNYHSYEDKIEMSFQLWNNKWGEEELEKVPASSRVVIGFNTLEDSKLLELCEISIDGKSFNKLEIYDNVGYLPLDRELSGASNDGSDARTDNYAILTIRFDIGNSVLKNGLKSMYLDLQYES